MVAINNKPLAPPRGRFEMGRLHVDVFSCACDARRIYYMIPLTYIVGILAMIL